MCNIYFYRNNYPVQIMHAWSNVSLAVLFEYLWILLCIVFGLDFLLVAVCTHLDVDEETETDLVMEKQYRSSKSKSPDTWRSKSTDRKVSSKKTSSRNCMHVANLFCNWLIVVFHSIFPIYPTMYLCTSTRHTRTWIIAQYKTRLFGDLLCTFCSVDVCVFFGL